VWKSCGKIYTKPSGSFILLWGDARPLFSRYLTMISGKLSCGREHWVRYLNVWCLISWRQIVLWGWSWFCLWWCGPCCLICRPTLRWIPCLRTLFRLTFLWSSTIPYRNCLCCWRIAPWNFRCRVTSCGRDKLDADCRSGWLPCSAPVLWRSRSLLIFPVCKF
jgi:hypothetical protein